MTNFSEDDPRETAITAGEETKTLDSTPVTPPAVQPAAEPGLVTPQENAPAEPIAATEPVAANNGADFGPTAAPLPPSGAEPQLFQSFTQPEIRQPVRIPHMGHLLFLAALVPIGIVAAGIFMGLGIHIHLFGVTTLDGTRAEIHYLLGSEAVLYLTTFCAGFFLFPLFWKEKFFFGVHWRGDVALRHFGILISTAFACIVLAILDEALLPGPKGAPIEKIMSMPGAAWLMFAFGVTLAPFFEEMLFRGFLLPSLCTAWDWTTEKIQHRSAPPLDGYGHPQWSLPAMVFAAILTSLPFALLHVEQQGHALGPFLLLILVSLILCTVRLVTRSLAASTLVHAVYNFMIFTMALIGSGGFRHFDKM